MPKLSYILFCATVMIALATSTVYSEDKTIQDGSKVQFDYTLKIDGQFVESSEGKQPLSYTHGSGQIIPGLSAEMRGLKVGDEKNVTIAAKDAYGEISEDAFRDVPKSGFPEGTVLQPGMVIELTGEGGVVVPGIVWEVKEEAVVINFNHPLAGKTLEFDVKVVAID